VSGKCAQQHAMARHIAMVAKHRAGQGAVPQEAATAGHGMARIRSWHGTAWNDMQRHGMAWHGMACRSKQDGMAWSGMGMAATHDMAVSSRPSQTLTSLLPKPHCSGSGHPAESWGRMLCGQKRVGRRDERMFATSSPRKGGHATRQSCILMHTPAPSILACNRVP